ncbi:MAG: YfhO family protein [Clostridia bacterium]
MKKLNRSFYARHSDILLGLMLVLIAVLCHARYLLTPELLFATEGDSFRQILPNTILYQNALAAGHPFWSWSFGLGGDMFTELTYAGTTSIFTYLQFFFRWLCGAVNTDLIATLHWKLAFSIVKQSIAMLLLFSLLRREKQRTAYAFIGALVYGCAPWFLYRAIVFDFMTDAYVLLPLVALAYAAYRESGRWIPLSISIALLIGTNFYFGYISCIFFASLFLVFSYEKGKNGKAYAVRILRLLGICFAGALLAAVAMLPAINGILSSDRTMANAELTFLPHIETLKSIFEQLFLGSGKFGLPLFILLALLLRPTELYDTEKKRTFLAVLWLVLLLIPATSSLMNGLSYETPRWHFIVIFAVSYAVPYWLTALERHGRIQTWFIWTLCAILSAFYLIFGDHTVSLTGAVWLLSFLLGLAGVLLVGFGSKLRDGRFARGWTVALTLCVALSGILNSTSVRVHNLYTENANTLFFESEAQKQANLDVAPQANDFYRVHDRSIDVAEQDMENRPYVYQTYGISNYASEINGRLSEWHKKTFAFRTTPISAVIYQSFDDRLFHDIAWDVRYKIPVSAQENRLPSNWVQTHTSSGQSVNISAFSTGFDLWYDSVIPEEIWLSMTVAERDAALLQTAAIKQPVNHDLLPTLDVVTTMLPLTFADASVAGGTWNNHGLLTVPSEATLTFTLPQSESEGEYLLAFTIRETSGMDRFFITANDRTMEKFADTMASESLYYPLTDYVFRYDGAATTLSMTLSQGLYQLSNLNVSRNSYVSLSNWVTARNQYNLEHLSIDNGHISGTIANAESGILALSMPLSAGWKCRVDGVQTDLIAVNGIFAGMVLTPGVHTVELTFVPPYLVLGTCITLITAVALCLLRKKTCKIVENAG